MPSKFDDAILNFLLSGAEGNLLRLVQEIVRSGAGRTIDESTSDNAVLRAFELARKGGIGVLGGSEKTENPYLVMTAADLMQAMKRAREYRSFTAAVRSMPDYDPPNVQFEFYERPRSREVFELSAFNHEFSSEHQSGLIKS